MVDTREDNYVCDLRLIMRSRLLFGLYSRRAVPPRWRGVAKAYCLTIFIALITIHYHIVASALKESIWVLLWLPSLSHYILNICVSFWTGDEYIYEFFSRNTMTDVTLDSSVVFNRYERRIKKAYIINALYQMLHFVLINMTLKMNGTMLMLIFFFDELGYVHSCTTKLLVMGLFNSRMLVLRRRLERYGFRTIGRAPPQPYCQVYDEIWQKIDATNNPLKFFLFFDLIVSCLQLIGSAAYYTFGGPWQHANVIERVLIILIAVMTIFKRLTTSFGHVTLLESSAAHCDAMAIFTATQLIKTPSTTERQRMYALLHALEQRGARYRVLRALPLDARLVLEALGFCSAQALVFINILKPE